MKVHYIKSNQIWNRCTWHQRSYHAHNIQSISNRMPQCLNASMPALYSKPRSHDSSCPMYNRINGIALKMQMRLTLLLSFLQYLPVRLSYTTYYTGSDNDCSLVFLVFLRALLEFQAFWVQQAVLEPL